MRQPGREARAGGARGPGSGCDPAHRRSFNPARYRVVLFDQRMCGRSRPLADDPAVDLAANTTGHLIADIERLRVHLGIERWLPWGMSWGSTLLLAYAQRYPDRVSEIVISGVTMTRRSEIDWLYRGLYRFFPQEWERFRGGAGETAAGGDLIAAYGRLMADPDPAVRARGLLAGRHGKMPRSPWTPAAGRAPTARGHPNCCWPEPAYAPTTSPTPPGWRRASCLPARTCWPTFRAC
jgi:pimeloyl-ACP methyl ester carboxylesterase